MRVQHETSPYPTIMQMQSPTMIACFTQFTAQLRDAPSSWIHWAYNIYIMHVAPMAFEYLTLCNPPYTRYIAPGSFRPWTSLAMEAVGSSDGQTATMKFSKETLDLESNTRFEYDPWLLDDHPLRSHPTECIPGLSLYLDEYYESIGKRRAILFRAACLILGCL